VIARLRFPCDSITSRHPKDRPSAVPDVATPYATLLRDAGEGIEIGVPSASMCTKLLVLALPLSPKNITSCPAPCYFYGRTRFASPAVPRARSIETDGSPVAVSARGTERPSPDSSRTNLFSVSQTALRGPESGSVQASGSQFEGPTVDLAPGRPIRRKTSSLKAAKCISCSHHCQDLEVRTSR